jgi:hypothetical protein
MWGGELLGGLERMTRVRVWRMDVANWSIITKLKPKPGSPGLEASALLLDVSTIGIYKKYMLTSV